MARLAVLSLAAILSVSAVAKSLAPEPAIAGLEWTGWGIAPREMAVGLGTVWEALLAAGLLVAPRSRWILIAGLVTCIGLTVAQLGRLTAGLGDCGCFGDLVVPPWITLPVLLSGALGTAAGLRGLLAAGSRPGVRRVRRWSRSVVAAAYVVLLIVPGRFVAPGEAAAESRLGAALDATVPQGDAWVLIGSWGCPHCTSTLAAIRDGAVSGGAEDLLVFAVRASEGETESGPPGALARIETVLIPDDLWWGLLRAAPPRLFRRRDGALLDAALPDVGGAGTGRR